jgi:RNA polymerase sigma factor (sigma-70 family)
VHLSTEQLPGAAQRKVVAMPSSKLRASGGAAAPRTYTLASVAIPLVKLVEQARQGDASAWGDLVERLQGVVWRTTADQGLNSEDRQDVFAATFFRLFEHLGRIREPEKLPGWVATTARNESRQMMRSRRRVELREEFEPTDPVESADVADGLLDGELRVALRGAFRRLGLPCQELLRLSTAVPAISYDQISEITGITRNSLGPTRHRCLERLRHTPELQPFLKGGRS